MIIHIALLDGNVIDLYIDGQKSTEVLCHNTIHMKANEAYPGSPDTVICLSAEFKDKDGFIIKEEHDRNTRTLDGC